MYVCTCTCMYACMHNIYVRMNSGLCAHSYMYIYMQEDKYMYTYYYTNTSLYMRMCAIEALCMQLRTQDLYTHAHVSDVLVYMYLTSCIYVICMKIRYMYIHVPSCIYT